MRLFLLPLIALLVTTCSDAQLPKPTSLTPPNQPNILLFLADDWSYPHATIYGDNTVKTPNFDALARGGRRFTNAYCASPSCSPSRASLLTGRYPHQNGAAGNLWSEFPAELTVYPEVLEAAGYRTGFDQKGWAPGDWRASGRTQNPTGKHKQDLRDFLDEKAPDQPFCFWFGTYDPHRKYERGLGVLTGMKPDSVEVPAFLPDLPCVRNDLLDYYAEIERLDRHLGQAVELLRARGELDNTLIIVTSDNGMPFPRAKANLYDAGTRMPFVAHWPARIPAGTTYDGFINLASLAPTFLDAAGLDVPAEMTLPSLLPVLTGEAAGAGGSGNGPGRKLGEEVLIERERHAQVRAGNASYAARALRNDSFLYIRNYYPDRWPAGDPVAVQSVGAYGDVDNSISKMLILAHQQPAGDTTDHFHLAFAKRPAEELYHLATDPNQLTNVASDPTYAAPLTEHRTRLLAQLTELNDPRIDNPQTAFYDTVRYVADDATPDFNLEAYISDYRYQSIENGTHFREHPCLPAEPE